MKFSYKVLGIAWNSLDVLSCFGIRELAAFTSKTIDAKKFESIIESHWSLRTLQIKNKKFDTKDVVFRHRLGRCYTRSSNFALERLVLRNSSNIIFFCYSTYFLRFQKIRLRIRNYTYFLTQMQTPLTQLLICV